MMYYTHYKTLVASTDSQEAVTTKSVGENCAIITNS